MENVKEKAAKGLFWTFMEKGGKQFIQFALGIIIARHLTPEDYGVVGMLSIFMAVSGVFLDSGIGNALIQKKDRTDEDISTAFYITFGIGIFLYAILYFFAPFIADFYKTPILTPITRVLSLTLVINSFYMPAMALLTIKLNFKAQTLISLIALFLGGIVGIFFATRGSGPWALVYYSLTESIVRGLLFQLYVHYIPHSKFSRQSFKHIFSFGTKILAGNIINSIYNNMYALVIGRSFNAYSVGIFNRGKNFPESLTYTMSHSVVKVAYPIFSDYQENREKLKEIFLRITQIEFYFLAPLITGMVLLAKPLIIVILKEKWLDCVPIMQLLCIGSLWLPFIDVYTNLFYSIGRTDVTLKYQLIEKPLSIATLFLSVPFGLNVMCVARIASSFLSYFIYAVFVRHYFAVGFIAQVKNILPALFSTLVMGGVVYFSTYFLSGNVLKLVIGFIIGALTYLLIGLVTMAKPLYIVIEFFRKKRTR